MSATASLFLEASREYLRDTYLPRIQRAVAKVGDDDLWWKPHADTNAIANLLLHLEGNVRQWILSGIGGQPDHRRRELEFRPEDRPTRDAMLTALAGTVEAACEVLTTLDDAALRSRRKIQSYDVTVLEAIYHVVEHFSWHTGQITAMTKERAGAGHGLAFYDEARVNEAHNDPEPEAGAPEPER